MSGSTQRVRFRLNGGPVVTEVEPDASLLEVLRDSFSLHGPRESCGQGVCGTCTVAVDGAAVSSCLFWAVLAEGRDVITVEGLGSTEALDPVQQAFIDHAAFQCGYCTPGMIVMVRQLLEESPHPSRDDVRRYLSGSLCRCGSYAEIVDAAMAAAEARRA